jgi:hypothetical protein
VTLAVQQPQGGALTLHPAVAALDDCGLLDATDVHSAEVRDLSRAHPVWLVSLPRGRRLVVKAGRHHGGPDLAVECMVYRMTAWCEPLAEVLPEACVVDEDQQLLVLADVNTPGSAGSLAQHVGFPSALYTIPNLAPVSLSQDGLTSLARKIGWNLGGLHRATAGFPLPPATPPVVLVALGPVRAPLEEPMAAAVRVLAARPQLLQAAEEMAHPVRGCLVNHDLKWDNIVVQRTFDGVRPVLLDWELAGLGDPAWDLGCLLAEHLIRSTVPGTIDESAAAMLDGYANGAALRAGVLEAFSRRVVLATCLRIAQLGLEVAATPASGTPDALDRLAELAATQLDRVPELVREVYRCLS